MNYSRTFWISGLASLVSLSAFQGCSDDEADGGTAGKGGATGKGGSAGKGGSSGTAGSSGSSGSAGKGGSSGTAGSSGSSGSAGKGGSSGTDGGAGKGGSSGTDGGSGTAGSDAGGDAATAPVLTCDYFCDRNVAVCGGVAPPPYANRGACMTACALFPSPGTLGMGNGNTLGCRIQHTINAAGYGAADPLRTTHCGHTASPASGQCV